MKDEDFQDLLDEVNAMSNEEYDEYHKQALNIKEGVEMAEEKKAEIEWHDNKCCCQDLQIAIQANKAWLKKDTALEKENERLKEENAELKAQIDMYKDIRRLEKTTKFAERYGFSTKQMKMKGLLEEMKEIAESANNESVRFVLTYLIKKWRHE